MRQIIMKALTLRLMANTEAQTEAPPVFNKSGSEFPRFYMGFICVNTKWTPTTVRREKKQSLLLRLPIFVVSGRISFTKINKTINPLLTIFMLLAMLTHGNIIAQNSSLTFSNVKAYEHQLDDVMELIDTAELKLKLTAVEADYQRMPNELHKVRLGIIYHEVALNLSFFSKTAFKGYAQKSFDVLSELYNSATVSEALLPFIASYRASALSLVGAETKKLSHLSEAFRLFKTAVEKYAAVSYLPEFLRGSVAENLPWMFFSKRKFAKKDFQSIIDKQTKTIEYANWKIMSFTYWAWAKQRQGKKYRTQAISYLNLAIELDPDHKAGRKKAEALKIKLMK